MSDTTLNAFVASGTAAERAAFTPSPPTPASGPDPGYTWYETDTGQFYSWDGSAWQIVSGEIVAPPPSGAAQNTFLLSGGQVTWDSGFTFRISAASYYINGVRYDSAEQTITLDAADGSNDRIDVIALDTSGTVQKITGTAAAAPSEPSVDPASYVKLGIVSVPASSTQPPDVDSETVYAEDAGGPGEWNFTTSGSGFTLNSTNNPHAGTKDIEGTTVTSGSYAKGVRPSGTLDPNAYDHLLLFIRSKASWNNNRGLLVSLRSSGVLVGAVATIRRTGTFGFDSTITASYQQVAIPITAFAIPAGSTIDEVRIEDFGGSIGFYIDDISFQVGATTPTTGGITQAQADARYAPLSPSYITGASDATLPNEKTLATVIARGTRGSQPAANTLPAGSLYYVTDENILERSTGAAWEEQAAGLPSSDDGGNSGTALTVDFKSRKQVRVKFTLTGNVTLTLSNPIDGGVYVFRIKTGAGGFTVTWPASVLWPGGAAPTITATASKVDLVVLHYDATASKYYGSFNQNY